MNFQQLATSEIGTRAWLALGALPPRSGRAFAAWLTRLLHRRKHGVVYRVLYGNQRQVLGGNAAHEEVDEAVAAVLRHAAMVNYDLVAAVSHGQEAILRAIELGPDFWRNFSAARATGRGVLVCGAHLSNFNLGFLSFAIQGRVPVQTLSAAMPGGGFDVIRRLRNRGMLLDTEIGASSLRQALQRLRAGGVALIGVDWPLPDTDEAAPFFGAPSLLSAGYIRLALSADAVLLPLTCRWTPGRAYHALSCPPIELVRSGDRTRDVMQNAVHILSIVEGWIRAAPDQWLMYHPVW